MSTQTTAPQLQTYFRLSELATSPATPAKNISTRKARLGISARSLRIKESHHLVNRQSFVGRLMVVFLHQIVALKVSLFGRRLQ
jgi:hypothetical protein